MTQEPEITVWDHFKTFTICVVGAVALTAFVIWDRRPPTEVLGAEAIPDPVYTGDYLIIRRPIKVTRRCAGLVYRQFVGPDKIIRSFGSGPNRVAGSMGHEVIDFGFYVPDTIIPEKLNEGIVTYQSYALYAVCGITSHFWPLEVPAPDIKFTVRRK